jgi:hypothetical protein
MTVGIHTLPTQHDIRIEDGRALVEHLVVTDPEAIRLLGTASPEDRAELLQRIISVGARGITTMGVGIDVDSIDARVRSVVEGATEEAERTVAEILERGRRSIGEQFDPEHRSSILARALDDFTTWRDEFLATLDPAIDGSVATALVQRLHGLVGPEGALERRLAEALDPDADDSAFGRLATAMASGFDEIRRDIARGQGASDAREQEAERGTAHGLEYEDVVETHLRAWAATRPGTLVERTTTSAGDLDASSRVGDFVITLADGHRIAIEAKRHARIALGGSDGILGELDRAMSNRRADAAVCIAGRDAYPMEVGRFNVYGDRILVVDEGDGLMTAVALQWTAAALTSRGRGGAGLDTGAVSDRIDRIRTAADRLSGARSSVTKMRTSLDNLYGLLGELRGDILEQAEDLHRLVAVSESLGS